MPESKNLSFNKDSDSIWQTSYNCNYFGNTHFLFKYCFSLNLCVTFLVIWWCEIILPHPNSSFFLYFYFFIFFTDFFFNHPLIILESPYLWTFIYSCYFFILFLSFFLILILGGLFFPYYWANVFIFGVCGKEKAREGERTWQGRGEEKERIYWFQMSHETLHILICMCPGLKQSLCLFLPGICGQYQFRTP